MKDTFEELSKKLDNEIRLKEIAERNDAQNRSEAESAGAIGALKGIFIGAAGGFVAYIIFGIVTLIFGWEPSKSVMVVVLTLCIIIGASIGGYGGYDDSYRSKRNR